MAGCNDMPTAAGCARGCVPCRGVACERYGAHRRTGEGFSEVAALRAEGTEGAHGSAHAAGADAQDGARDARDVVQETVDAVSGATWGTRNMIMEDLFRQDMADHGDSMPAYRPPGE